MTLKLHCFGESGHSYKAALALEMSGLDWDASVHRFLFRRQPQRRLSHDTQPDGRGTSAGLTERSD